jgi:hypothetical protein
VTWGSSGSSTARTIASTADDDVAALEVTS